MVHTHTCNRYFYSIHWFLYLFLLFNTKNLKFNIKLYSVSVGVMNNIPRYWHRLLVLYSGCFCLLVVLGNIWRQLWYNTLEKACSPGQCPLQKSLYREYRTSHSSRYIQIQKKRICSFRCLKYLLIGSSKDYVIFKSNLGFLWMRTSNLSVILS